VEHPCYRCGASIEDGTPFCPRCNAPQIRVDMPEGAASPPLPPGTPGQLQPPAQPVPLAPVAEPGRVQWRDGFPAAVAAGVLIAIAWAFPWASFLLWGFAGGVLAVLLYQRRHAATITPGMGARLGVVAGLLGFLAFAIIASLELLATRGAVIRAMWSQIMKQAEQNPNPAVQEMLQRFNSPEGMAMVFTFAMIFVLGFFLVFSSIGGAIGARLFGRREK
jgi:hypothetical protein